MTVSQISDVVLKYCNTQESKPSPHLSLTGLELSILDYITAAQLYELY